MKPQATSRSRHREDKPSDPGQKDSTDVSIRQPTKAIRSDVPSDPGQKESTGHSNWIGPTAGSPDGVIG
jgi:hypothetical protein